MQAPVERWQARLGIYALRAAGLVLAALVIFPIYRLLDVPDAGLFPRGSIAASELAKTLLLLGSFIAIAIGVILSRLLDASALERVFARAGSRLVAIPIARFATALALIAGILTAVFSIAVLGGKPNLIDAMVQLVHGRYLAAGQLGGPVDQFLDFWQLSNSLVTPNGWVSQYPPGYALLLATGFRLGVVALVGPFLFAITVLFTALAAGRLLPEQPVAARLGALMLCLSPFAIGLAGAFMNHVAAAAFFSAAVYFAVRSRDTGGLGSACLAGASVGGVFSVRPLTALVAAAVVAVVWLLDEARQIRSRTAGFFLRTLAAVVGIAPLLIAVGLYNQHFFGSPFIFGYSASQGPLVGPGFHRDPTGAYYGPVQALGYTSADLVTLSLYLLETPIPAVLVVALFLLLTKRFTVGARVIAIWALLPVAANALYWHHGMFMGPRMLNEAAPAWVLLTALSALGLLKMIPPQKSWGNYSPRAALSLTFLLAWAAGLLYLGPSRLLNYGREYMESSRLEAPKSKEASLVFVHGAWTGRIAMNLIAHGMRLDSVEAAMRQNPTCDAHSYALWYSTPPSQRATSAPPLDFSFIPHDPPPKLRIAAGDDIRVKPGTQLTPECLREVASDTLGIVDVGPLLWQGDLPGLGGNGAMFVRDMGPDRNAVLIQHYVNRLPMMLLRPHDNEPPQEMPYREGMALLWKSR